MTSFVVTPSKEHPQTHITTKIKSCTMAENNDEEEGEKVFISICHKF